MIILYPKLLQPRRRNYPGILAEIEQSITPTGRRVAVANNGDINQGQEISKSVLGGLTAGILIRGDVWHQLGGLAPESPLHRDGVDFGQRANEAGHRVVARPDAVLTHRRSGRTGERSGAFVKESHEADHLTVLQAVAARDAKLASTTRLVIGNWLRAIGLLLAKSSRFTGAELWAARRFTSIQGQVKTLAARSVGNIDISRLLPRRY